MSLFNHWQNLEVATDEIVKQQIKVILDQLRQAACNTLTEDAVRFSRLGDSDEQVYDQLIRMMDAYRKAVGLIEAASQDNTNPAVNELLTGINDILTSRLKQFEDTAPGDATQSPVTDEKRGIIERALLYTARQIEDQANRFPDKIAPDTWAALRGFFLLNDGETLRELVCKQINEIVLPEMYVHYKDGLRFCLLGLDDLHGRKIACFYAELIEREWEVLEALICIQVQALETALETASEGDVPVRVLNIIREVYQQTGPFVENIKTLPQATPRIGQASLCRPFDEFAETLGKIGFIQIIDTAFTEGRRQVPDPTLFFEAITEETASLFGQQRITFLKAAYRLQRMIGVVILLAEEATALFDTAYTMLKDQEIEAEESDMQIVTGITETLGIKIESLRESIQSFNGEGASLLQAFAKEKNDTTDEIKEAANLAIREAWLVAPPAEADIRCFFTRFLEGEVFAPHRADYEKHVNQYTAKMEKAVLRFKKEVLLYEVCTYEEILTHSVSRLNESENEEVRAIAARLHGTYASLEVLLRKNNITPIRPAPHEPFNGKEHEVLVAEKQEGFNKGEIIKLVGNGYRYNDQVLMRANVIAAR
jgi:molecular chaperone GrpE (heat shock protein)